MDILEFDPSQLDERAAKDIAEQLVALNQSALDRVEHWVAGESVEQVLRNEEEYSKIWKPIAKEGYRQVAANRQQLEAIQAMILAKGMAQMQRNDGALKNLLNSIGGSGNVNNRNDGSAVPIGNVLSGGTRVSNTTATIDESLPGGIGGNNAFPTVPTMPTGNIIQPPIVGSTAAEQATSQTIVAPNPIVFPSQGTNPPTTIGDATKAISSSATVDEPCKMQLIGTVGYITTSGGLSCPSGYFPSVSPDGCWGTCIKLPVSPPPPPSPKPVPSCIDVSGNPCPPGFHYTYTYPPGVIECHPDTIVPPQCPKPTGGCQEGYDWWNDPTTGVWKCTLGGVAPPKPDPKPVPACDKLNENMRIVLNVGCNELPKETRQQLEKCGYLICKSDRPTELGDDYTPYSLWDYIEPIEESLVREVW